ncbi:MAG: LPS assembly protein LptD, partial [Litorivicinaceae bacterium]
RWSQATRGTATQEDEYFAYGVSIDGRLHFEKSGPNGSLHEMIPRAKLSIRELNRNPAIVKFDTPDTANDIDKMGQIFLDNPISGSDFVGDTRDIALALTTRGINANGVETYHVSAGRTIYLQDRGVTLSGDPENAGRGPLVIESKARLGKSFNWNTRFRSVTDGETMDTATNELKYQISDTDYVTQRIVWDNDAATRTDHYISNQVSPNWRFLAGLQWEPHTEERTNQVIGVEYEGCCWRAAMVHAYERDQVTATNGGHSVKVQVELKGLGALGRGTSKIMERLLEGYELSEPNF